MRVPHLSRLALALRSQVGRDSLLGGRCDSHSLVHRCSVLLLSGFGMRRPGRDRAPRAEASGQATSRDPWAVRSSHRGPADSTSPLPNLVSRSAASLNLPRFSPSREVAAVAQPIDSPRELLPRLALRMIEAAETLAISLESFERNRQRSIRLLPFAELERWLHEHVDGRRRAVSEASTSDCSRTEPAPTGFGVRPPR